MEAREGGSFLVNLMIYQEDLAVEESLEISEERFARSSKETVAKLHPFCPN